MPNSPALGLPLLAAAQAQKHVTVNEALMRLDVLTQMAFKSRSLATPPVSPAEGDTYLIPSGATGAWATWDLNVAVFRDGVWMKLPPRPGWQGFTVDSLETVYFNGSAWIVINAVGPTVMARSPRGAQTLMGVAEAEVTLTSGSTTATFANLIPNRAVVLGVSVRVTQAITGTATGFDCGVAGDPRKFGESLGKALSSTNSGVIGPTAYYAPTGVVLTAVGGTFTAGKVRAAVHYFLAVPATS